MVQCQCLLPGEAGGRGSGRRGEGGGRRGTHFSARYIDLKHAMGIDHSILMCAKASWAMLEGREEGMGSQDIEGDVLIYWNIVADTALQCHFTYSIPQ